MSGWYNGFSPAQRSAGGRFHKARIKAGEKPRHPEACVACGGPGRTPEGKGLSWHSEDYSEPHGPHIGRWGVCFCCHMVLHCRKRSPQMWEEYRRLLREGHRVRRPWSWPEFQSRILNTPPEHWHVVLDAMPPAEETWLDQVDRGEWNPDPDRLKREAGSSEAS